MRTVLVPFNPFAQLQADDAFEVVGSPSSPDSDHHAFRFPCAAECAHAVLSKTGMPARIAAVMKASTRNEVIRVSTLCSGSDAVIQTMED